MGERPFGESLQGELEVVKLNQPVRGSLGSQSGYGALQALEIMQVSGTLLLEQPTSPQKVTEPPRYWLGLCQNGRSQQVPLGEELELSASGLDFTFYAHRTEANPETKVDTLPQFSSYFPQSSAPALRALPALGAARLSAHDTNLRALVTRLVRERFTGTLALVAQSQQSVMLFFSGRIGAAFHEVRGASATETSTFRGSSALRATLQLSDQYFAQPAQGSNGAWLELRTLPPLISASLLGLAQEQTEGGEQRSGVEVSSVGYTYYNAGLPYLFIAHTAEVLRESLGFYTPAYSTPSLSLPSEPPGWEEQRYYLTLRRARRLKPHDRTRHALRARVWPHRTADLDPARPPLDSGGRGPLAQRGAQRPEAARGEARGRKPHPQD